MQGPKSHSKLKQIFNQYKKTYRKYKVLITENNRLTKKIMSPCLHQNNHVIMHPQPGATYPSFPWSNIAKPFPWLILSSPSSNPCLDVFCEESMTPQRWFCKKAWCCKDGFARKYDPKDSASTVNYVQRLPNISNPHCKIMGKGASR